MKRSKFNLSHYRLTTADMGQLVPVGLIEVLPGDTVRHSISSLIRFSPLAAPVMHRVDVRFHSFFVPHRLIWEREGSSGSWEDFITGGPNGDDAQTVPMLGFTAPVQEGSVADYYGIPAGTPAGFSASRLPFRGYQLIYNEFYRDQDLVAEDDRASREVAESSPLRIAWEKDYFSGARPFQQKGPDITIPLGTSAPVLPAGPNASPSFEVNGVGGQRFSQNVASSPEVDWQSPPSATGQVEWDDPQLIADLSNATGISVNELRKNLALQRFAEARARFGSRYTEYLAYLGVRSSDARLQRPEYLGGGRVTMNFSEVLQTAPEGSTPIRDYGVGDMYGHGAGALRSRSYRRFFEEHGYIHTLMSVRPRAMYRNAVPRHWLKGNRNEFYQRELMQIGQQPILAGEVYSGAASQWDTFGWADRYAEYKSQPDQVSGEFASALNYWHLARDFDSEPALNQAFVECDPSKRIFNEQTQHSMWCMIQHRIAARRLVSKSGASRIL